MCFGDGEPDLKDRDPYNVNKHIRVRFPDVIAEPDNTHSCDCTWQGAGCCYEFLFTICYGLPTCCCHWLITLCWGVEFGVQAFWHVWLATPTLRCAKYVIQVPATCLKICCRCCLDPWCESAAYMFMFCEEPTKETSGLRIY